MLKSYGTRMLEWIKNFQVELGGSVSQFNVKRDCKTKWQIISFSAIGLKHSLFTN